MKEPSKERGCDGKMKVTTDKFASIVKARQMADKHGKAYGLYKCPHCEHLHLTTKIENADNYKEPLIYITPKPLT